MLRNRMIVSTLAAIAAVPPCFSSDPLITSWRLNYTLTAQCPDSQCTDRGIDTIHCEGLRDCITAYLGNVQTVQYDATDVYVSPSGLPIYNIGPFPNHMTHNPDAPTGHDWDYRFPRNPTPATTHINIWALPEPSVSGQPRGGTIGLWLNGVAIYSPWDARVYPDGAIPFSPLVCWHRNAVFAEEPYFDSAKGHPASDLDDGGATCGYWDPPPLPIVMLGYGVYHHHQRSAALAAELGDATPDPDAPGEYLHSPILGFAFDGYPVYGPYGYANADGTGGVRAMTSGYSLRARVVIDGLRDTRPDGSVIADPDYHGPTTSDFDSTLAVFYEPGYFLEDYAYSALGADLDEHNGRCCVTPEYPGGTYAYFTPVDPLTGENLFPYAIGPTFYGVVAADNFPPDPDSSASSVTVPDGTSTYDDVECTFTPWVRVQKLTADSDAHAGALFGQDVAIAADLAAAGAPLQNYEGAQTGVVFAYRDLGTWLRESVLSRPPVAASDIRLGRSVALDRAEPDRVITGDEMHAPSGGAYVFQGPPWGLFPDLPVGGVTDDNFGHDVAIEGDVAVVSAESGSDGTHRTGAVNIMRHLAGAWSIEQTLYGVGAAGNFGVSVAIGDGRIVIGNSGNNEAYVYEHAGTPPTPWIRTATLAPSGCAGDQRFGFAVDICGDRIVVGSPDATNGQDRAYVYRLADDTWRLEQQLQPTDAVSRPAFGWSVAITSGVTIIGAPQHATAPDQSGAALVFERCYGSWTHAQTLQLSGGDIDDGFARNVDVSCDWIIIGAHLDDERGANAGAAYLYTRQKTLGAEQLAGFGEFPTSIRDIWEPPPPLLSDLIASGSTYRSNIEIPVIWRQIHNAPWTLIDLSHGQPLSGRVNRISGDQAAELAAGAIQGGDGFEHATVWRAQAGSWLADTLPEPAGSQSSEALSALRDGAVTFAVGFALDAGGFSRPVLWIGATPQVLPGLSPSGDGRADHLIRRSSGEFLIVGTARDTLNAERPVVWRQTGAQFPVEALPLLPGGVRGTARDIAADAAGNLAIAGDADTAEGQTRPVVWIAELQTWSIRDFTLPATASGASLHRLYFHDDFDGVRGIGRTTDDAAIEIVGGCDDCFVHFADSLIPQGQWLLRSATAATPGGLIAAQAVPAATPNAPQRAVVLRAGVSTPPRIATTWSCTTGGGNWMTSTCWSNLLPGDSYPDRGDATYDVTLPAGNYAVVLDNPDDDRVIMDGQLDMQGNQTTLRVGPGKSIEFFGPLLTRGILRAEGGSIIGEPGIAADMDQTSLFASRDSNLPGVIRLPITAFADLPGAASRTFNVSGVGSRIELPNLATITGDLGVVASNGGLLDMPSLTAFDPAEFTATGVSARINVPSLTTLPSGRELQAVDGGRIDTAPLTSVAGELRVDGPTSYIDVSQVANIDGARITAASGAQITIPLVTGFTGDSTLDLLAALGADSLLDLPAIASINGAGLALQASNGGRVRLPALAVLTGTELSALNANSVVELPALSALQNCDIRITGGATILAAPLTDLSGGNSIEIAGATSTLDTSHVTTIERSTIEISSAAVARFPLVTSYVSPTTPSIMRFRAQNAGSLLDLNALTSVQVLGSAQLELRADGNGGRVEVRNLQTLTGGNIRLIASGSGSILEVGDAEMPAVGRIEVGSGGRLIVRDDLRYGWIDPTRFEFAAPATLEMSGGQPGECAELEIAGENRGDVPAGWSANFQLDRLVIAAGARVRLVDLLDNGNRSGPGGVEALYVETLEFADPAARLDRNNLPLYVGSVVGSVGQIINGDCGCPGDTNGSGSVELGDLAAVLSSYGQCAGNPGFNPAADFDRNGCVELNDLSGFLSNFGTICE